MTEVKTNIFVNTNRVQEAIQKGSEYYLILSNGKQIQVTKEIFDAIVGEEE